MKVERHTSVPDSLIKAFNRCYKSLNILIKHTHHFKQSATEQQTFPFLKSLCLLLYYAKYAFVHAFVHVKSYSGKFKQGKLKNINSTNYNQPIEASIKIQSQTVQAVKVTINQNLLSFVRVYLHVRVCVCVCACVCGPA